jgi:uncharacterized protein (DUF1499 family)
MGESPGVVSGSPAARPAEAGARRGARAARLAAWGSVALALAGALAQLVGAGGYRMQAWSAGAGIAMLGAGALAAAAAALVALVALLLAWRAGVPRTLAVAVGALALGVVLAAPTIAMWRLAATLPAIHDISTDTENPPRFDAILPLRAGAPNDVEYRAEVAAQQRAAYPDIAPALLPQPPQQAFALAERAARAMGWAVVAASPTELRIEATATTRLFGFRDDIVVRVTPAPGGSRIDVRSVSRVGRSDVGTNARRIRAYLRTLGELSRAAA